MDDTVKKNYCFKFHNPKHKLQGSLWATKERAHFGSIPFANGVDIGQFLSELWIIKSLDVDIFEGEKQLWVVVSLLFAKV